MKDKLEFIRLPILLFVIFFIGRLALGAAMGAFMKAHGQSIDPAQANALLKKKLAGK